MIREKDIHNIEIVYCHDLINRIWTNVFPSFDYAFQNNLVYYIQVQTNGQHFAASILKFIFLNESCSIQIALQIFPKGQINSM